MSTSWNTEERSFNVSELDSALSLINVSDMDNGDKGRVLLIISIVLYTTYFVYYWDNI